VREISISNNSPAHLVTELSYEQFFERYHPVLDGEVFLCTYSFSDRLASAWPRMAQISTILVDQKYQAVLEQFGRRFPLFELYSVPRLHRKCIYFAKSGVLLIGSQNVYEGSARFLEASLEITIPEAQRNAVIDLLFRPPDRALVLPTFTQKDLRIFAQGRLAGFPCILPNLQVQPWDLFARRLVLGRTGLERPNRDTQQFDYLYHVREYSVDGQRKFLAFGGGYNYCGDLTQDAFDWLHENALREERAFGCAPKDSPNHGESYPGRDRIYTYHPTVRAGRPRTGFWFDKVRDPAKYRHMLIEPTPKDITEQKIFWPQSLDDANPNG
jgi:hypothetical protein